MKSVLTLILLFAALAAPVFAQTADDLFQQALREERVTGNTEAAIGLYRQIAVDRTADRTVVVRALLQMGKAYESLGRDGATSAYARIVNEFGDFAAIAAEASTRMAALRRERVAEVVAPEPAPGSIETILLERGASNKNRYGWVDYGASVSPDGEFIARIAAQSSNWQNTVILQEVRTGMVDSLSAANAACPFTYSMLFSPDGSRIAMDCANENGVETVFIYDRRTASAEALFSSSDFLQKDPGGSYTRVRAWSEDGLSLIVDVQYYPGATMESYQRLLVPVAGSTPRVLEDALEEIRIWEDPMCGLRHDRFLFGAYGDNVTRNSVTKTAILRSDLAAGTRVPVLADVVDSFQLYACLPSENTLIFGRTVFGGSESIFAVSVGESGDLGPPRFLAMVAKGAVPIPGAQNGNIYFWDVGGQKEYVNALVDVDAFGGEDYSNRRRVPGDVIVRPRWSSDGMHLAGTQYRGIVVLDGDGQFETKMTRPERAYGVSDVVWSPSGERIIASSYPMSERSSLFHGTQVFELQSGRLMREIPDLAAVAWLADERGFLYVSDDGRCLRSFVLNSGATAEIFCTDEMRLSERALEWAQTADGNALAFSAWQDSTVVAYQWDLSTGRLTEVPVAPATPHGGYLTPRWSADGRHIFFSYLDGAGGTTYDLQTGTSTEWSTGSLSGMPIRIDLHPGGRKAVITASFETSARTNLELSVLYQPTGLRPPK